LVLVRDGMNAVHFPRERNEFRSTAKQIVRDFPRRAKANCAAPVDSL
jgi:hypothetical protein